MDDEAIGDGIVGIWGEVGWEMTLMKWDSSHVLNHCFSLLCSLQPASSNLKTRQTGMGGQFPSSPQLKGIPSLSLPLLHPPQGNYLTHGMVWWNPCKKKKKSDSLTSISPSPRLHPSEWLPSSFHRYKAKPDLNNQIPPSPTHCKNRELSCSLISICQHHSHTCLPPTGVCVSVRVLVYTHGGRTGGKLTNRAELVIESKTM